MKKPSKSSAIQQSKDIKAGKVKAAKTVKHKTADTPPSRRLPNRDVYPFFKNLPMPLMSQ